MEMTPNRPTPPAAAPPPMSEGNAPTKRKKHGGRVKGTPNKVTSDTRQWLAKLLNKQRKQIEEDLQDVEPKDRLLILEKFMQYVIPKRQQVAAEVENLTDTELARLAAAILTAMEGGGDDH